jgi:hypothetical protein
MVAPYADPAAPALAGLLGGVWCFTINPATHFPAHRASDASLFYI